MRFRAAAVAVLVVGAFARTLHAGNLDGYYMGSQAALQAGAVTADATGGAAVWYNPSGLSEIEGLRLDASANAFRLSLGAVPDLETTDGDTSVTRLRTVNLATVPSSLTLTRRFGDVGVGIGVFVPAMDSTNLRSRIRGTLADEGASELGVDSQTMRSDYYVGPGFGWRVSPALNLGASLLVLYRSELSTSLVEASVAFDDGSPVLALVEHQTDDWQQIGVQGVLGLKLHPGRHWASGITLRLPVVRLYQMRQTVSVYQHVLAGDVEKSSDFDQLDGFETLVMAPARVHLGLSRRLQLWHFALEANYQFPLSNDELRQDMVPVANVRAGVRRELSRSFRLGGGLYTDRSPIDARAFAERALDYYGVTFGGELATPYETVQKRSQTFPEPRPLVFATAVALSYAVGLGDIVRADVSIDDANALEVHEAPTRAVAHEIVLHVSSTLGE